MMQSSEIVNPNDRQVGGDHYTKLAIQPWEAMEAWMTPEAFQGFLVGNVIKYLARQKQATDLEKAQHYLNKLITAMSQPKKDPPHAHSTEPLSHFRCENCQQWWSIGDCFTEAEITLMHCPRCGIQRVVALPNQPQAHHAEADITDRLLERIQSLSKAVSFYQEKLEAFDQLVPRVTNLETLWALSTRDGK